MASKGDLNVVGKLGVLIAPKTTQFSRELAEQLKKIKERNDLKPTKFKVALDTKSVTTAVTAVQKIADASKIEIPVGLNEVEFRKQVRLIKALAKAETIMFNVAFKDKDVEAQVKAIQRQIKNMPVTVPIKPDAVPKTTIPATAAPRPKNQSDGLPLPDNDKELISEFRRRLRRAGMEDVKAIEKLYKEAASKLGTSDNDAKQRIWLQSKLEELKQARQEYDNVIFQRVSQPNGINGQRNLTKQFEQAQQALADRMDGLKKEISEREGIEIDVDVDTSNAERELKKIADKKRKPTLLEVKLNHRMLDGLLNTLAAIPMVTTRVLTLGTAFTTMGAMAGAAVIGTSTFVASLKELSGVAGLLPAALGGVVAMGGTLATAFNGIGSALSAVRENAAGGRSASKSGEVHAIQLEQARDAIAVAQADIVRITEEGRARIVEASKAVGDAQRNIKDSAMQQAREVQQAEERLYKANRTATETQKKLNDVREEAKQKLKDLREELNNAALDERKAAIEAEKARQRYVTAMNDGGATSGDTRNELLYEWDRAQQNLTDSKKKVDEVRKEKAKADKEGVNGTEAVLDATEKLRDAMRDQQDAARDLSIAQVRQAEAATDAQERLHDAHATLAKARRDEYKNNNDAARQLLRTEQALLMATLQRTDTASVAADEMAKLTENGREFVRTFDRILGKLKPVRDIAQSNFFAEWTRPLERMIDALLPQLHTGVGGLATALGEGWGLFADGLRESLQDGDLQLFLENITEGVREFNNGIKPLISIINDLGIVGSSFFPEISKSIAESLEGFAEFISTARQDGSLRQWMQDGIDAAKNLFGIFKGVAGFFGAINKAAQAAGLASSLESMNQKLESTVAIMNEPVFQDTMTTLFKGVKSLIDNLKPGFRDLGQMFVESDESIGRIMGTIGAIAGRVISIFAKLFSDPEVMAGMERMFEGILEGLNAFNPDQFADGLGQLFTTIGDIAAVTIPTIAEMIENVAEIIETVGPIISAVMDFLKPLTPMLADLILFIVGLKGVSAGLGLFKGLTGKGPDGLLELGKRMFGVGENAKEAGEKAAKTGGKFSTMWTKLKDVGAKMKGFTFPKLTMPSLPVMNQRGSSGLAGGIASKGGDILGKAGGLLSKIAPVLGRVAGMALRFVPVIGTVVMAVQTVVWAFQNWDKITEVAGNVWASLQQLAGWVGEAAGNIGGFFVGMFERWKADADLGVETIKGWWNGFWGWLGGVVDGAKEAVGNFWKDIVVVWLMDQVIGLAEIQNNLEALLGKLTEWVFRGMEVVGKFFMNLFTVWYNDTVTGANIVMEYFNGLPGKIKSLFENAGTWIKDAGKNLWDGFIKGMGEAFPDVAKKVDEIMKGVGEFFVNSPAKKGRFSGKGHSSYSGHTLISDFAEGMRIAAPGAVKSVEWIMNQLGQYFGNSPAKKGRFRAATYSDKSGLALIEDFAGGMVDGKQAVLRAGDLLMNTVKLPTASVASAVDEKRLLAMNAANTTPSVQQTFEVKEAVSARATAIEIARLSKVGI